MDHVHDDSATREPCLALQLGVRVHDKRRQVRDGAGIDDRLRELGRVLADVAHGRCRDALESYLGLLNAQHQQRNSPGVQNILRQV